jgi:hypothetical protein
VPEFDAGVLGGEPPVDVALVLVDLLGPGVESGVEGVEFGDPSVTAPGQTRRATGRQGLRIAPARRPAPRRKNPRRHLGEVEQHHRAQGAPPGGRTTVRVRR